MGGGLTPAQANARAALTALLEPILADRHPDAAEPPLFLVACSGGADSLALASTAAFLQKKLGFRAGAIVIDHQLQEATAAVADRTAATLRALGLAPVLQQQVEITQAGAGVEAAARAARYAAFEKAVEQTGATGVLLGHTKDDQAEQVLLGLVRGSGTRSLAGMPPQRGHYYRPFLKVSRAETEQICTKESLTWWEDPTNADPAYLRSRIRTHVLPELVDLLGDQLGENLARTAEICRQDADIIDSLAQERFATLANVQPQKVELDMTDLKAEPAGLRARLFAMAAHQLGAEALTHERTGAIEQLLAGSKSAGPVQLPGGVEVWRGQRTPGVRRQNPAKYGKLVFITVRS
ncbi:tRNA lysidine(34) synthetase TilS [Micrococcoides hystricis]|uniref:tRNA(Ile)-lysidine synthase n=1 Tax=Micrococcoides hystricis TaxID=1572761 RepID=A0ABV6PB68_9MICC